MKEILKLSKEVACALNEKRPVVALESSVIAQGLPYPKNKTTALELEALVRNHGATPATIYVKDQKICVGLELDDLECLAQGKNVIKAGARELAFAVSQNLMAATTVSSTLRVAKLAGIEVFATGGIGGVHRGGHISFDISADLLELANTSVLVVCAGIKSILDIERTLEQLETLSVPVIGYQTQEMPSFYSQKSGHFLSMRADEPEQVAQIFTLHKTLARSGMLLANPIPQASEIPTAHIDGWLKDLAPRTSQLKGGQVTPFLLKGLFELSLGKTLEANCTLLYNNAQLAARIAVSLQA